MADSTTPQHQVAPTQTPLIGRWVLLGSAILQAISPSFIPFSGTANDPPFVPPGPFFSIWGVILIGCVGVAVIGFPAHRAASLPFRRIQFPLSFVQLGFIAWLVAATSPGRWILLTVPVFVAMLGGLSVCLREVRTGMSPPADMERVSLAVLDIVLGVYAGWSTPAIWLNVAAMLPPEVFEGSRGVLMQCIFVGVAAASAAVGSFLLRGQSGYTAAAAWGLIGVTISVVRVRLTPVAVTAVVGLLGVVGIALFQQLFS